MYNRSIVLDDPPAPAARVELGLLTVEFAARRLKKYREHKISQLYIPHHLDEKDRLLTEFVHQAASLLRLRLR